MTNTLIEAIAKQLGDLFPETHVYIENTEQHLAAPCFLVSLVSSSQRERLGDRVFLDELYSVTLIYPDNIRKLREITELAELSLRFIELEWDLPMMTQNRTMNIIDDTQSVITFYISRTVWFEHKDPLQEKLRYKIEVNDDQSRKSYD